MNKIQVLEQTIFNLENNVYYYNWDGYESCNVGILSRTIIGGKKLKESGYDKSPSSNMCGAAGEFLCLTTNLPLPEVFQAAKDCGFTYDDMNDFEVFTNRMICDRAGLSGMEYKEKAGVIKYLKAWIEILKEETPAPIPKVKEKIRYISVPESITQQAREQILTTHTIN